MRCKSRRVLLMAIVVGLLCFTVAQACEVATRNTTCKAHWHQTIPLIGSRWPCIEGAHSAESDTSGHTYNVKVVIYQNGTKVGEASGSKSTKVTTEVANATGTAMAECTGACNKGDGTLIKRTPKDSVW